ncbi:MAG: helix-turn-helix domain-containing protein [Bacillota bacterium]
MTNGPPPVAYWELLGTLERKEPRPEGRDVVVLSNIDQAADTSPGAPGLSIRYVARGCENYRIGGRGYRLEAGQVMIARHDSGADCEVRRVDRLGTLGVCTLVHGGPDDLEWAQVPLIVAADCTPVGAMLKTGAKSLWNAQRDKISLAENLIQGIRTELPRFAQRVLSQAAAVDGAKPSTRFEMVRRAHLAQAYLHATTNRAVDLNELAAALGVSPFRLLTAFQQSFGESPAAYHRKLRLGLAMEEAKRRGVRIGSVCDEFGFADCSSFSHAYRRTFGRSPVWSKARAA